MAITIKDLEEAMVNAHNAGDSVSAKLMADEISKIERSRATPQDKGITGGLVKRGKQVASGVEGLALRTGEMLGVTSPEDVKRYEEKVQQERSVMSPTYGEMTPQTTSEFVGSVLPDVGLAVGSKALSALQSIPFVGRAATGTQNVLAPQTVPQAITSGAIYSTTTPSESGSEAIEKAVTGGVVGGGSQFGLRQVGLAPLPDTGLTEQQKQVARRALNQGFILDPTQITGYGGGIKEGLKSNFPFAGSAFTRFEQSNQTKVNDISKQLLGIPANAPLTNDTMANAYQQALGKYQSIKSVPTIVGDVDFTTRINAELAKLKQIKPTQLSADDKRAIRVLNDYKDFATKPVTGEVVFNQSKKIGEDLWKAQKSGSKTAADAFKELRSALEDSVEKSLQFPSNQMRTNSKQVLDDFREGRKTLSDWYTVKAAFNEETGNVSSNKLASQLSKKPTYGRERSPIETAAMFGGAFPKAFPSSGTSERLAYGSPLSMGLQLPLAIPSYVGTSQPVRNILAQRYLGARPKGVLGNLYGAAAYTGSKVPQGVRSAFGDALRNYELQQQMVETQPTYGLLGQ